MKSLTDCDQPKKIDNSEKLNEALECSSDGILISDDVGNVIFVNKAYEETTGLKKDEIIGKNLKVLLDEKKFNTSVVVRTVSGLDDKG